MSRARSGPDGMLSADERALWRDFLTWSQRVITHVSRDIEEGSLSVTDLEVLGRLWEHDGELDQQDLQAWLRWSPSRLSHQLARMSQRGLVRRFPVGSGRRMTVALTEDGEAQAVAAFPRLATSIRERFLEPLTQEERAVLRDVVGRDSSEPGAEIPADASPDV